MDNSNAWIAYNFSICNDNFDRAWVNFKDINRKTKSNSTKLILLAGCLAGLGCVAFKKIKKINKDLETLKGSVDKNSKEISQIKSEKSGTFSGTF